MFQDVVVRRIGTNKNTPRVYIDCADELERADFRPGAQYRLTVDEQNKRVVMEVNDDGDRIVSVKMRGERRAPVVDLQSFKVLKVFEGFERIRVIFLKGRIFVLPLASDLAKQERLDRLCGKVERGEALTVASLCHGGGMLAYAAHEGLQAGGVSTRTALVNEIDEDYAAHSRAKNPVWDAGTKGVIAPMQELVQDEWVFGRLPRVEVVEMGIPCSGASKAGATKRKLAVMEEHPEVGHLIASALMLIQKLQPACCVIENVPEYSATGSAWIARSTLRDMGYTVYEVELNAADFGCLEARRRWFLVAMTDGVALTLDALAPELVPQMRVGDILEPVADDDPRWSPLTYLREKEQRDAAAGKGFQMQTVTPESTRVPTLRKAYHKGGSTDPYIEHPSGDGRLRKFSGREHASLKGFPAQLIDGLSETRAHEVLGQGVAFAPVRALFERIGACLKAATRDGVRLTDAAAPAYSLSGTG